MATPPGSSEEAGDLSCGGLGPNPRSWGGGAHPLTPPPHLTWNEEHPEQPPEPGLPHPSCALTPAVLWLLAQLQRDTLPQRLPKVAQQDVMPLWEVLSLMLCFITGYLGSRRQEQHRDPRLGSFIDQKRCRII